jgi:hypothetical protein
MSEWLSGKKTYILGGILIVYVGAATLGGWEPDDAVVYGLIAGMGITLRRGVAKAER